MLQHLLNFIGIGLLSAMLSVAAIIGNAMRIDKDPAIDGPRALIAEFFGLWAAFAFLAWSFMIDSPERLQWILRGIAAGAGVVGLTLAAYFAGTTEVRVKLDEEPTGFEKPITALQLQGNPSLSANTETSSAQRDRTWSGLNTQH